MVEYLRAGRWEKKLDLMFTEELVVYNMGVLKHFASWDMFWFEDIETFWDRKLCMNFVTDFFI